jgi:anti-sigma regulatory factor (Ser/Thr protein kinase)
VVGVTADTDATVTLRLPPSAAHVRTARLIAAAVARRSGVGDELLDEVRLAVGEACARAVRQHERHGMSSAVTVEFVEGDRFRVAVVDRAAAVPEGNGHSISLVPGQAPWADPSGDALGLALLGAVVQDLAVGPDPDSGGTRVTMSWPLG